jgi:8-oxo-dGTP diphosphatase
MKFLIATNDYMPAERKYYVMVCIRKNKQDVLHVLKPHKCEGWERFSWKDLQSAIGKQNEAKDSDVLERPLFSHC